MQLIAAIDKHCGIGKEGKLLFHIPDDLAHFKKITIGGTLIMGRKTFESIGRPLPGRNTIVFSRGEFSHEGVRVVKSINELFDSINLDGDNDNIFLCGGGVLYSLLYRYCTSALLTCIDADGNADVFVPDIANDASWKLASFGETKTHEGINYSFKRYVNESLKIFDNTKGDIHD